MKSITQLLCVAIASFVSSGPRFRDVFVAGAENTQFEQWCFDPGKTGNKVPIVYSRVHYAPQSNSNYLGSPIA